MCSVPQLCPTFCDPLDCSPLGSSVHGIFRKNTGVGCHFLPQGIFPTQGSNLHLLCLLHWQADPLPLCFLGSLKKCTIPQMICKHKNYCHEKTDQNPCAYRIYIHVDNYLSLSIHTSIHPSMYLPIYLSTHSCICLSIYPSIYPSMYLYLSTCASIYPLIHLYTSIYLSIYSSIHLSTYLSILASLQPVILYLC